MACHTPPLKKSEATRGNAITQPQAQSHPSINSTVYKWDGTEAG